MWILPFHTGHPATILSVKTGLGHVPTGASMSHGARRHVTVVTQLLQTGLSHPLLLVARGHLLDHHCCILSLLQRLLLWPGMLEGTWWKAFVHRWGEISRYAGVS